MSEEIKKQFEELSFPLMKFLAENFDPYQVVIVTSTKSELLSGAAMIGTNNFTQD